MTRQNKALKAQNMQYESLSEANDKLSDSLEQNQTALEQTTS